MAALGGRLMTVTNRAIDPSLEVNAGASVGSTLYTITDDSSVKYAGTRSKRSTRTVTTPGATIGGVIMSGNTSTSGHRILVTPGEVISASAKVMIDRAGRVRVDAIFRDTAGVNVGATVTGPYTDAPVPGTWYTAKVENLTVPAGAAYVYINAYAVFNANAGPTVGGEVSWFDALIVNDGPVALPYFDGATPDDGTVTHAWTGPVNNSTSTETPVDTSNPIRSLIAAAASSVPGISVTPYFRQTTKPGDGMVRLERMNRDTSGFGYMATWQVVVVLPQDLASAEKYLDEKVPALLEAISEELVVTTVTPQQLALDTGLVPVVFIEGNRAS